MRSLPQDMSVAVPFLRSCLTFYLEEIRFSPVADAAFVIQEYFWTIRSRSSSHAQTVLGWHYKTTQFVRPYFADKCYRFCNCVRLQQSIWTVQEAHLGK